MDLFYIAGIVGFCALSALLVVGCHRSAMMTWTIWLAGASSLLLFVYLVYALLRAEDLE
jgi:K+-transporting ATPase KdpF subunit